MGAGDVWLGFLDTVIGLSFHLAWKRKQGRFPIDLIPPASQLALQASGADAFRILLIGLSQ